MDSAEQLDSIAIIGMAGRFPDARDIEQFEKNLRAGRESVTAFTDEQLRSAGVEPSVFQAPTYVKSGVVLDGVDQFDAGFFGYTPREAELTDPQHRLFLESAWEALEDAGYDPDRTRLRIGVFAGSGANSYFHNNLLSNPHVIRSLHHLQKLIATESDYLSTRVSYKLNLKGPSLTIQTACSSSLVATHVACQSLLNGECDMALAGGVSIKTPQTAGYLYEPGSTYSPDGRCRAFDASAQGMMIGSGVGIVVLKRLADALADDDSVRAVILASAINNDGAAKAGFTAPSIEGPASVVAAAHALAGVGADDVSYVEAMGTGTALGDPVEVAALTKAFRKTSQRRGFCALGSVKTNIGHLGAASGIAGLLKVVFALQKRVLFPSLNFKQPNPAIDFANSPFYVQRTLEDWHPEHGRRVAGVSSFGVGGTNAHIIIEEPPATTASGESQPWQLLPISAKTPGALEKATDRLADFLESHPGLTLADVAFTLQQGRKEFAHRRILAAKNVGEAVALLRTRDKTRVFTGVQEHSGCRVAFMFPGRPALHANIGLETYLTEKTFRRHIDFCSEFLKQHLGFDLREVLYPSSEQAADAGRQLKQTVIADSSTFIFEYALAQLWIERGVNPEAMIGQGIGEFVAACLAGVFSVEDALALVVAEAPSSELVPDINLQAPRIPCVSSVTGTWIKPAEATDPYYWSNHASRAVRFAAAIDELMAKPERILLEVSPDQTLSPLCKQWTETSSHRMLSSFARVGEGGSEAAGMLTTFGQLWNAGVVTNWNALCADQKRRRVPLPSYPFERQRYWIEAGKANLDSVASEANILNMPPDSFLDLPNTPVALELAQIWKRNLGIGAISAHADFFDLGGDSLLAIRLINDVNNAFGIGLTVPAFAHDPTIGGVVKLIEQQTAVGRGSQLIPLTSGNQPGTVFFLASGVGISRLAWALGDTPPMFAIAVPFVVSGSQDPTLGTSDAPPSLAELAAEYRKVICQMSDHGPCVLVGHSFSGLLAFEVAHQLLAEGKRVDAIFILDTYAKGQSRLRKLKSISLPLVKVALAHRAGRLRSKLRSILSKTAGGSLANRATSGEPVPETYFQSFDGMADETFRKVIGNALKGYHLRPLACRAVLFRSTENHIDRPHQGDYDLGWRGMFSGGLEVIEVAGDHWSMLQQPHLSVLARRFQECLDALAIDDRPDPRSTSTADLELAEHSLAD